ncbi:DUF305 domain-containing protein [Rhodobacter lacus]|uniref:DUF305 domain-containing protein n=1 Tax=Rhodobacter lacus TaxID=1641972 RepID=A0ABW5A9E2_9RHOB
MPTLTVTARAALLSPLAFALAFEAYADEPAAMHMNHEMPAAMATADAAPSTAAFLAANAKMHAGMDIPFTGDADVDFVRGMIAHHQGAIDMAKIEIDNGDDPQVRKLAEGIIDAQQEEIDWMTDWLEKHGQP